MGIDRKKGMRPRFEGSEGDSRCVFFGCGFCRSSADFPVGFYLSSYKNGLVSSSFPYPTKTHGQWTGAVRASRASCLAAGLVSQSCQLRSQHSARSKTKLLQGCLGPPVVPFSPLFGFGGFP